MRRPRSRHSDRLRRVRRTTPLIGAVVVFAVGLVACGDGGDTVAVESTTSTTSTTDAASSLGAFSDDYCERAEQLAAAGDLRLDEDPDRAAAAMETLAAVAPPGGADEFAVVTEQLRAVSGLGTTDPSDALELIDLLLDPGFLAALDRVEQATLDQCGVRLGAGVDEPGD